MARATYANGTLEARGGNRYLHRVVLGRKLGRPLLPDETTDHINRDRADNRRENLRTASKQEQRLNRPGQGGTSRFKGVSRSRGKWKAAIQAGGRSITLGRFYSEEEAARAYDAAAKEHFGEFAYLNLEGKT